MEWVQWLKRQVFSNIYSHFSSRVLLNRGANSLLSAKMSLQKMKQTASHFDLSTLLR